MSVSSYVLSGQLTRRYVEYGSSEIAVNGSRVEGGDPDSTLQPCFANFVAASSCRRVTAGDVSPTANRTIGPQSSATVFAWRGSMGSRRFVRGKCRSMRSDVFHWRRMATKLPGTGVSGAHFPFTKSEAPSAHHGILKFRMKSFAEEVAT